MNAVSLETVDAIMRQHYMPAIEDWLNYAAAERRVRLEIRYGMPNIMPRFDWWPWMRVPSRKRYL